MRIHRPDICVLDVSEQSDLYGSRYATELIRYAYPDMPLILLCSQCDEETYLNYRHLRPSSFLGMEISRLALAQAIDLAILQMSQKVAPTPETGSKQSGDLVQPYFFRIGDAYQALPMEDIQYFYASDKLIYAKVAKQFYPTNTHLKILEEVLQGNFIRIHKTYLVNIHHIEAIHTSENNVSIGGQKLPIGSSYRKTFLNRMPLL